MNNIEDDKGEFTGFDLYLNGLGLFFMFFGLLISPWIWGVESLLIFILLGMACVETALSSHKRKRLK